MKHAYTIIMMMTVAFASHPFSASAASPAASAAQPGNSPHNPNEHNGV